MAYYEMHSVSESAASLSFFGVPYAEFDRTGCWAIWNIAKTFEGARVLAVYHGFLDVINYAQRNTTFVIVKQHLNLNPKVHELSLRTRFPMLFELKLLEVGKTSVLFEVDFRDASTKKLLGQNVIKFVRMNRNTRRPVPFPDHFRETYGKNKSSVGSEVSPKQALPEIPKNALMNVIIARHSDMDGNNHVNQCSYIKFCMDLATRASLSGYYVHYTQDMCAYAPLQWTISYAGECVAEDELHIYTWQNDACAPENIQFAILLKDRMIFHASTVFGKEPKKRERLMTKL